MTSRTEKFEIERNVAQFNFDTDDFDSPEDYLSKIIRSIVSRAKNLTQYFLMKMNAAFCNFLKKWKEGAIIYGRMEMHSRGTLPYYHFRNFY
jgi:hypothetical protein